jgi:hypothetical protein
MGQPQVVTLPANNKTKGGPAAAEVIEAGFGIAFFAGKTDSLAARSDCLRTGNAKFRKARHPKISIMENTTKIERSRRPKIDPDDALRIGVVEHIVGSSVENHPYVAVVQHRYDFWTKPEALIVPERRIVALSKGGEGKSMLIG